MKQIVKNPEPKEFSEWKAIDRMAHRPNWDRVRPPIKNTIHESLMREQGFICCYCEARVTMENSHIEHYRPITKYRALQLVYTNLHCSCLRQQSAGVPDHCGHRKASWFDEKLLVSPLEVNCENRFRFIANGEIFPRSCHDSAAETTIRRLGLDLPRLNALRAAAVAALDDLSRTDIQRLLGRGEDGSFPPYFATIRDVLL